MVAESSGGGLSLLEQAARMAATATALSLSGVAKRAAPRIIVFMVISLGWGRNPDPGAGPTDDHRQPNQPEQNGFP